MEITAQLLRDVHPPEAFRGYQRDEVDALLDRAAVTIEQLERENRALKARRPNGKTVTAGVPDVDPGVIERALVHAQKAADQAVAEAQAHAERLKNESEAKARALVQGAEADARRIADTEKAKLETEIEALASTRDALTHDVEVLEEFAGDYRERIQRAIDAEIERLHASAVKVTPPGTRPVLETMQNA
jgi:DivIVA domain-containing protein